MKEKKFSNFLSITILLFVGLLLSVIIGGVFFTYKRAITQEFRNLLKADKLELESGLQTKLNMVRSTLFRLAENNALKINLMLGLKSKIKSIIEQEYPRGDEVIFFIRPTGSKEFIPKLENKSLKDYLESTFKANEANSLKILHKVENKGLVSIFTSSIQRRDGSKLGEAFAVYNIAKDPIHFRRNLHTSQRKILLKEGNELKELGDSDSPLSLPLKSTVASFTITNGYFVTPLDLFKDLSLKNSIFFASPSSEMEDRIHEFTFQLLVICGLVSFLGIALFLVILSYLDEPLSNMAQQATKISKNPTYYLNLEKIKFSEFRQLASAFNHVLDSLFKAQEMLKEKAQQELEASEQKFVQIVKSVPSGIQIYRYLDGQLILIESNPAADKILSAQPGSLVNKEIQEIFPDEISSNLKNILEKKSPESTDWSSSPVSHYDNERQIDLELFMFQISQDLITLMFMDVTERKRLEQKLQQGEKMHTVGLLAGGVAHDLNNIFSALVSLPDLLLLDIPSNSPLREDIELIKQSGERAAAIVQDLLTLTRRGVQVNDVVNLNDIIHDVLTGPEIEKLQLNHPKIYINTSLDDHLLNLLGSNVHLSKTIYNLISNAAEAMPHGGKIFIETENCYVDSSIELNEDVEEGDYVVLKVADGGVGISPEEIGKIFEPFYTKKVMGRSGTGLGMAVVWGTVQDHKGIINVKSTKDIGTVFTLFFPVTRLEAKKKTVIPLENLLGNGQSILVVDDVLQQRIVASRILEKLNYKVHIASTGEAAIEFMKENSVDLIILDMIMDPGINGCKTYEEIIKIHPGQKAIIASGFSETEDVKLAQSLGAGQYIKKPYTLEKLGLAVKAAIQADQT